MCAHLLEMCACKPTHARLAAGAAAMCDWHMHGTTQLWSHVRELALWSQVVFSTEASVCLNLASAQLKQIWVAIIGKHCTSSTTFV